MRTAVRTSLLLLWMILLVGVMGILPAYAATPPELVISDGSGNSITVDFSGTVTYSSPCTNCASSVTVTPSSGQIKWTGNIGIFSSVTVVGTAGATPKPFIDVAVSNLRTTTTAGTLNVAWGGVGFSGQGPFTMQESSGFLIGTGTANYMSYVDGTNTLLGTGTLVGSLTESTPPNGNHSQTQAFPVATPNQPFSMTNQETISLGTNSFFSNDFQQYGTPPPPLGLSCSAGSAEVGVAYSSMLVATGGVQPWTFSVIGNLPNGLFLDQNTGVISGTPTQQGVFSFTAQVMDDSGNSATNTVTQSCTISVPPPVSVSCPSNQTGVVGVPYTGSLVAMGGTTPYTYSVSPANALTNVGLSLDASSGAITGTPTQAGPLNFTAQVMDSSGGSAANASASCTITYAPPPSANCVAITAIQGVAITPVTLTASGGTGTGYTFSSTDLPAGLMISSGGTISGTPTVSGTFTYHVTITDSAGNTGTTACSVTINPPPSANCVTINAVQGVAITPVTLTASGGTGTGYTFSSTDLPAGLMISSGGTISGTPTVSGTFTYHVTITDSAGNTGTLSCSVTILPPVSANCVVINAVQGIAIMPVTLTASGGTGTGYTFSSTDLPAGLMISTGGTISGTPTVSGTFTYHVTVTDSAGNTGTISCSVTILPPVSATCVSITAVAGVPITPVTLMASGGTGTGYTFSSSDLPAGLMLSSGGTISGTPTVSGTFTYHVTVKDSAGNVGLIACQVMVGQSTPPPLIVSCPTQGTATVGTPFSSSVPVSGGTPPYTYALNTGSLPPGLTLNPDGTITGTPTSAGSFTFSIKVTDSMGMTAISQCSSSCTAVMDNWTFLDHLGTLGTSQSYTVNGLTITAYGYYYSNPTTPGTPTKLYGKQDGGDENGLGIANTSSDHEITNTTFVQLDMQNVLNAGATSAQMSVGSVQTGESYAIYGSNTLGVLGTQLATNLTADDTVFNVPNFGNYRYVALTAVSHDVLLEFFSVGFPQGCTIVVSPAPLIVACPANTGKVGVPYSSSISVSGGTAPYTFQITSGSLPPGLTLNSTTGAITGTPTAGGTYTFTTTVTDSTGGNAQTVAKKCTITVSAPPTPPVVSCPPNKGGNVGTPFSTTIPVTGGTAPFTFSISSGSLPPGLTLNTTTGVISGTPTTAGTYSFTIMVVDGAGNVVYSSCDTGCSNISEKFDFLAACGKFGSSKVYKTNGIALTAYGFDQWGRQKYLNGRGNGDADDGLGISGNLDDGIDSNSFVQYDVSNVIAAGATDIQVTVGSIHPGETYNVYGSNTLGQPGSLLLANCKADGSTIHVPSFPNHKYICIKANNKCVHVKSINCTNPCKCSITISKKGCTYTKGDWGNSGNDGWNKAHDGWGSVYGSKNSCVKIGGSKSYTFSSADAAANFLNKTGNPGSLWSSSTNPTSGNDFATQVLSLQMNVDFSNSGVIAPGLANLKIQSGLLKGWTVQQVLDTSNQLLGGDLQLPYWMQWSDATSILSSINAALENGNYDSGYLNLN